MKKYFFYLLIASIAATLVACGGEKQEFVIDGTIHQAGNLRTIALYEGERKLDSAFFNERGQFKLRRTASHPRLFTLVVGSHRFPVILENGDRMTLEADLMNESGDYQVSGSPLNDKLRDFAVIQREKQRFEQQMDEEFVALSRNLNPQAVLSLREEFIMRYQTYMDEYTRKTVAFAEANDDLAGFYAMSTLDREFAEDELIAYADKIAGRYDDNAVVRQFLEQVAAFKRLAVGQPAPLFESLTPHNRTVKLDDFQGQYTLVDFWASWCVPCREENPNIVAQYNKYKDQGFTVLGVSLDSNPGSWLRAIEEDGLEWEQVSDLQAWKSEVVELYDIKAIPTSYLLDPSGIIIAKNLRGEQLEDFLNKTFAK